jgi:hypothetical protein
MVGSRRSRDGGELMGIAKEKDLNLEDYVPLPTAEEVEEQIKGKAKWGMVQITIRKNRDIGFPVVGVVSSSFDEEHEWLLSESLAAELVKELKSHLYQVRGEFTDSDLPIKEALDMVSVSQ